jgi:sec-independent protein translocase protein TatA
MQPVFAFLMPNLGPMEMVVVMGIAVLLFGKRLPEVGRSLGKGIVEFKKGLQGMGDEFDFSSPSTSSTPSSLSSHRAEEAGGSAVPKFEPPASTAVPQMEYEPPKD